LRYRIHRHTLSACALWARAHSCARAAHKCPSSDTKTHTISPGRARVRTCTRVCELIRARASEKEYVSERLFCLRQNFHWYVPTGRGTLEIIRANEVSNKPRKCQQTPAPHSDTQKSFSHAASFDDAILILAAAEAAINHLTRAIETQLARRDLFGKS